MKIKSIICATLSLGLIAGAVTTSFAGDKKSEQAKLQAKAKVSKADATKTALAKVPGGRVKEVELEEEKGKLIWSFDIAVKGSKNIQEVAVDAMTGEVVSVETETPADQSKEKADKKKETKK